MNKNPSCICAALLIASGMLSGTAVAQEPDARANDELRNTVINLLQGLVERGVLTREQAEKMVRDAQEKAAADAAARASVAKEEENAVRVPYVPEIIKDEIRRYVETDMSDQVTRDVMNTAQSQGWGVPAGLPAWIRDMTWSADVRMRAQSDLFASDNLPNVYLDFQRINDAGGISRAGYHAFTNVTENRERMRVRFRFGFETILSPGWSMGARLATGGLSDPISTNQTLGAYGERGQIGVDLAWIDWQGATQTGTHRFGITGGKMRNPFFTATDLVYDQDLAFDGVALSYRYALSRSDLAEHRFFVTAGAFPLQEVELSSHDKWLVAEQIGLDLPYARGGRTRVGVGYHRFINMSGKRNALDSNLLDYTAPLLIRRGNTVFDIRNDTDPTTNLYALAADYNLVNVSLAQEWAVGAGRRLTLSGDYVRNVGYSQSKMQARTGFAVPERSEGYQVELAFGSNPTKTALENAAVKGSWIPHAWRAAIGYRYLQRDAVIDALTDSDFLLGGTDSKGYTLSFQYNFTSKVQARLKYQSGNEIDGLALGIDVLQLDVTASF